VSGVRQEAVHAYDRIEIPEIVPDVTRVTLYGGTCPCCARRFKAVAPVGLEPGSPFGANLRAFVLYLRFAQAIPFERLARLMSDLLGVEISEGAIANMLAASSAGFSRQASLIRDRLLSGSILQSDETSARVGKKNWWTWVFHHGDSARFVVAPGRGKAVVAEFLGDVRPDFWVSDRFGAQMGWATTGHQACLAHLLRDVHYAIDAGDDLFAPGLKNLLKDAVAVSHRRDHLKDSTLFVYAAKLEARLDRLLRIEPIAEQGRKLVRIIKKYRQNLFVFVTKRDVPPTNNGSERAAQTLCDLPQDHQLLPLSLGRQALCRCQVGVRDGPTTWHYPPALHTPDHGRTPTAGRPVDRAIGLLAANQAIAQIRAVTAASSPMSATDAHATGCQDHSQDEHAEDPSLHEHHSSQGDAARREAAGVAPVVDARHNDPRPIAHSYPGGDGLA
jgi:transposase